MYFKLNHMTKKFGYTTIFDDVNIELTQSGLYYLTGESGSGKTTLLNIIAGFEKSDGQRELSSDMSIACIFQNYELIDDLNVMENISIHSDVFDVDDKQYRDMLIDKLSLRECLNQYPKELSGGQKQRVGIIRALLLDPQMIICDEPTESLDIENKEIVLDLLKELSKDRIVIVASHEESLLKDYYDYHYEIIDKKVTCTQTRNEGHPLKTQRNDKKLNTNKLKYYLKKMLLKNTIIYLSVFILLLLSLLIFSQVKEQLFKEREYNQVLNYDTFIVSFEDNLNVNDDKEKEEIESFLDNNDVQNSCIEIPFTIWNFHGKAYNPKTVPYTSNHSQLEVQGDYPKDQKVIINQFVANRMMESLQCNEEQLIGQKIELNYKIEREKYPCPFEIGGIVNEEDAHGKMNIYYDYDYLKNILLNTEYTNDINQYEYLLEKHENYIIQVKDITKISNFYHYCEKNSDGVYHNVLSYLKGLDQQELIYEMIFLMIQLMLCIAVIIYSIFYVMKDTKKNIKNIAILTSVHISLKNIKKEYLKKKWIWMTLVIIIPFIEVMIYMNIFESPYIIYYLIFISMIFVFYLLLSYTRLSMIKERNVSQILKESKDF